jgi:hypothetical protein
MTTRIKLRRDTAVNWDDENPVLALGEPGFDTTNDKLKIGDGQTAWQDLDYLAGGADLGKFKIATDAGIAFLATTDNADGYGGYDIAIAPSGESSAYIQIPNNANSEIGAPLTINSLAANSSVQINTDWADPWIFGSDGVLIAPDDIIAGSVGDGGRFIQDCDNGTTSMRWINMEIDSDQELIRAYSDSGNSNAERVQLRTNWLNNYQSGLTIRAFDRTNNNSVITHNWTFRGDGNLQLPADGDIVDSNGISVLSTVGARNITLANGSTITDQLESVDITVGRVSNNPYWYNIFGDTGATNGANVTINGSVVRDTGGNVYAIGSVVRANSFDADNLFLKYSPLGELLWRKTWTDNNDLNCGSYNASVRYLAANVELGTQDTIVWAAYVPFQDMSYVGTMDTEGNMVDQFGNVRLATRLDSVKVTDLEWGGNIGGVGDSVVSVVGHYYASGPGLFIPFVGGVDLDTADFIGNITVTPAGSDQSAGAPLNISYTNTFKAAATPAAGSSAIVGTYYDGTYSHAMLAISSNVGPPTTIGIGVSNYSTDNVAGEDLCCDENGNVYVIVNNISSDYAVLIKSNLANLATGNTFWQTQLGFDLPAGDGFYATTVAYDNGYVYVLGQYYDDSTGDTDAMIIKVAMFSGDVVWQRRIGSPGDDGVSFYGTPGLESSSGITVQDDLIVVSFATEARTPGVTDGPEYNTVTLQYPVDGSILGTFGDFVISDFDIGNTDTNYSITTLTTTLGNVNVTSGFATLDPTVQTVGTGWTNTQWDLENNIQIFDPQTFKFNADGTFDTAEIRHQDSVKITANTTVANAVPSTWTFQNNDGLRFPDGTTQYGAYLEQEIALDGGSAVSVFPILSNPRLADGGGSGARYGTTAPNYDGETGGATANPNDFTLTLNGGGA